MEDSNSNGSGDASVPQLQDDANQTSMGNQDRFEQIKSKALEELLVLLPETDSVDAEKRFDIYINDLHETGNVGSAELALAAAFEIEDHNAKANALSELVDEVDYRAKYQTGQ